MRRAWWWAICLLGSAAAGDLELLLPGGVADPAPRSAVWPRTLNGLWLATDEQGGVICLELYAGTRFAVRDSQGGLAAGQMRLDGKVLLLTDRNTQRAFVFDLGDGELRLQPDSLDRPRPPGALAAMPPHGVEQITWRRRAGSAEETFAPTAADDLLGEYATASVPSRPELLRFEPGNRYVYQGPGGLESQGAYRLDGGLLTLDDGTAVRRLQAHLRCSPAGWVLDLARDESSPERARSGVADIPPALQRTAIWIAPLKAVRPADLAGSYEVQVGSVRHRLVFTATGDVRYSHGSDEVTGLRYRLDPGGLLTVGLDDGQGGLRGRRFLVQPLPSGLLLVRLEAAESAPQVLLGLPPTGGAYARYNAY